MPKVKPSTLTAFDTDELLKQLDAFKAELAELRVKQVASGTASKLAQIKVARKNIARCLTVYNAKRRSEERAKYAPGALLPKPLRAKQTRAKRRELTAEQASKTVRRVAHRAANFPTRNYAVLA